MTNNNKFMMGGVLFSSGILMAYSIRGLPYPFTILQIIEVGVAIVGLVTMLQAMADEKKNRR